ncbi:DUF1467 domain-containing protein [Natronoglomus mannanivorans]|uniref:DUF1467 domain-containing protein n=1 Tax=Natronoglomus mannanivorans TaxID=2979990 RepID=A0AAP2YV97_9EURY|nr:DUF1467 domain-containing protein [Halobacteria archaeon AArc-xg1-1]
MDRYLPTWAPPLPVAISAAAVATGVAINTGFEPTLRTIPALLLVSFGLAGVANHIADYHVEHLRRIAHRWWLLAFVAFLPYGLVTSPSSESAAAMGEAFAGPIAETTLEAFAGASILCAVAVSVLYGFARYGIHPGRPTPEDRLLDD